MVNTDHQDGEHWSSRRWTLIIKIVITMRWLWWPRKWGMIWWCSWSMMSKDEVEDEDQMRMAFMMMQKKTTLQKCSWWIDELMNMDEHEDDALDEQGWGWGRGPDEEGLQDDEDEDNLAVPSLMDWRTRMTMRMKTRTMMRNKDENEGKYGMRMDESDNLAELLLMNWWTWMIMRMSMKTTGVWLGWGWRRQPCRTAAPWQSCRCCPKEGSTRQCTSHWEPPFRLGRLSKTF